MSLNRYARQLTLPEIGASGQERLAAGRVLLLGAGALGCAAATGLVAAGVGTVALVDDDRVEESNLARQTLYRLADIGRPKVEAAAQALRELNPETSVVPLLARADAASIGGILAAGYDLVLDGTDDYATRRLAHDAALAAGVPYVWGSALGWDGQVTVFRADDEDGGRGATLDDLYPAGSGPDPAASCAASGVFGPVCAAVGALMAGEAMKLLLGAGSPLVGRLAVFDGLDASWREIRFAQTQAQPEAAGLPAEPASPAPGAPAQPSRPGRIDPEHLAQMLAAREAGDADFLLIDVREPWEAEIASIPGSQNVPLQTLLAHAEAGMSAPEEPVVVYCHHGPRSQAAAQRLSELGWADVVDLRGGIAAWAEQVDPVMPRY